MKRFMFILSMFSFLFGTHVSQAANDDSYLAARNGKTITVPRPLSGSKISKYFVIKSSSVQPGATPVPPSSKMEKFLSRHPLQKSGLPVNAINLSSRHGEPTLWLNQSPSQAYESVRIGLAKKNVTVASASKRAKRIEILDTFSTFDRIKGDTPVYLMTLRPHKNATIIRIRTRDNQAINSNTAKRLLTVLADGIRENPNNKGLLGWIHSKSGKYKYA